MLDLSKIEDGDILLFHCPNPDLISSEIMYFERGKVSHAAICERKAKQAKNTRIVESIINGVSLSRLDKYRGWYITVRRVKGFDSIRRKMVAGFADGLIGIHYGFLDDVVDGVRLGFRKLHLYSMSNYIGRHYQGYNGFLNCSATASLAVLHGTGVRLCKELSLVSITPENLLRSRQLETITSGKIL